MRLARRDQATFNLLLPLPQAELAALGFHAQQAAEKAIKAVLVVTDQAVSRTHDLVALATPLTHRGLPVSLDELRLLNPFAVEFRYDDEIIAVVTREQLAGLLAMILDWASAKVEPH